MRAEGDNPSAERALSHIDWPGAAATWASVVGLALLALALMLLVPRTVAPPDAPPLRLLLVDVSPSATRVRTSSTVVLRRWLVAEDRAAAKTGEEVTLVLFGLPGSGRRRVFGPAPAGDLEARLMGPPSDDLLAGPGPGAGGTREGRGRNAEEASGTATDLAGALGLAATLLEERRRPPGTLHLLTDGTHTGADPRTAWRACSDRARVGSASWPAADLPDASLVRLDLPRRVEEGAPLAARVDVAHVPGARGPGSGAGPVELEVTWDDERGGGSRRLPVELADGGDGIWRGRLVVSLGAAAPGITDVTARVICSGDPIPENDRAQASTRAGEALVCSVLVESERQAQVRRWIGDGGPGLQMRFGTVAELGAALSEADLLWTIGIPPDRLDGELLRSFIEAGGGWFACGGWGLLQGWLPSGRETLPQSLLPLQPVSPEGERDVILMVDGSGSMAGEPFEQVRRGILEMARATLPDDHVSLRFFTGVLGPNEVGVAGAGDGGTDGGDRRRSTLMGILAARVPGGTTDVLYSLDQLAAERERARREALVLLLTDGRTALWDSERARAVADRLARTRSRLRVFPIGARADREFLGHLLAEGEELVEVADLGKLGEVFQREVNQRRIREGERLELVPTPLAGTGAWEGLARSWADATLPPVRRLARAEVAQAASVLWTDGEGAPVLALRQVGLGAVALLATDPVATEPLSRGSRAEDGGGVWAPGWVGQASLLRPLLRVLGRGRRREPGPRARWDGEELVVESVPADWPALLQVRRRPLEGSGTMPLMAGPPPDLWEEVLTPGTAPAELRERRGRPTAGAAALRGPAVLEVSGPAGLLASLPLASPRAPEFDPARVRNVPDWGNGDGQDLVEEGASAENGGVRPGEGGARPAGLAVLCLGLLALALGGLFRR
jgi:hypothetical protein